MHKTEYYQLLGAVTEDKAWEDWILYMLAAIEETARWTCGKVHAIRSLLESTVEFCREKLRGNVYSKELVELIFFQPYCKIAYVVQAGIAERKTASAYLRELENAGVLGSAKVGRERIYVNTKLLDLLRG